MKFPKEQAQITNQMNRYLDKKDYLSISKMKNDILNNIEILSDTNAIDVFVFSTFQVGNFDEVISVVLNLQNKGYESFQSLGYMFCSCVAINDIYQALSIYKKSKLLNTSEIEEYILDDGANYSNIMLLYDNGSKDESFCLVLLNFIIGISKEMNSKTKIDKEYLLYRFFDLMNMIHELGYDEEFINDLIEIMKNIFLLEI